MGLRRLGAGVGVGSGSEMERGAGFPARLYVAGLGTLGRPPCMHKRLISSSIVG